MKERMGNALKKGKKLRRKGSTKEKHKETMVRKIKKEKSAMERKRS